MYTLDTNAIIYYLKGDEVAVVALREIFTKGTTVYISAITEVELFGFSRISIQELNQIEELLMTLAVIPVDSRIARTAGEIRRKYNVGTADSVIAATAMFTGTTLVTRNARDFQKLPNLNILHV